MPKDSVAAVLERLSRLYPKNIDLSLNRMSTLLKALGNPQNDLPPVIHIAGTNGKGSTLAFIRAFLQESGKSVHVYTSPHLVKFNERIVIGGKQISDKQLLDCLLQVEDANEGAPLTFFEATTAAAFLAFSAYPADFVLLETGMGGRLDATNVIKNPVLTLIASLSMDHEDFLGHTLAQIAAEKAAIFKSGAVALSQKQLPEAQKVLETYANDRAVALKSEGKDWKIFISKEGFYFNDTLFPHPALKGVHQYANAALAIAAVKELNSKWLVNVTDKQIAAGLKSVQWSGRMEKLNDYPIPEGWELWIDGGHNPGAAEALAAFLPEWEGKPLHIVCGMLTTKDSEKFLKRLAPFAASLHTVPVPDAIHPGRSPADLAKIAEMSGFHNVKIADNIPDALTDLTSGKYSAGRILVCGSLYLLGNFLSSNKGVKNDRQ